jgi:flagellar basal-body rod protein FlgB
MIGKLDDTLAFHEAALSLRAQRQQLLASNIANADTPNYKARDIDFRKALQNALSDNKSAPVALTQTSPDHLAGSGKSTIGGVPLLYRTVQQGSVDNNTVDMDVERNQFTDNSLRYEASVTLIGAQIKNLLAALQG